MICSVDGESAQLVELAGAGLCIEPENKDALVTAIRHLQNDTALRQQLGMNGRSFVKTHYLRSALAEKYIDAFIPVVGDTWSEIGNRQLTD